QNRFAVLDIKSRIIISRFASDNITYIKQMDSLCCRKSNPFEVIYFLTNVFQKQINMTERITLLHRSFYFFDYFLQFVRVNRFQQKIQSRKTKSLNRILFVSRDKNHLRFYFSVFFGQFFEYVKSCSVCQLNIQ